MTSINNKQPVLASLLSIMSLKNTNLCVSVDEIHSKDLLKIAREVGPHICMLKTHVDILVDFSAEVSSSLRQLADSFNFLIMEDRKFADIGNTVKHQYANGIYNIQSWADIVTVHAIPGSGQIEALKSVAEAAGNQRACVLIAEMSSKGALTDDSYQNKVVEMAKKYPEFVIGFVSQHKLTIDDNLIIMTPGVNISEQGDRFGQQYSSPEEAIEKGSDVIIVGRGICQSSDISKSAELYKNRAYSAYLKKCHS